MYRNRSVAVVVPAYDEAAFVGQVLRTIPPYVDRVYAVDDRSTDETWAVIRREAARSNDAARASAGDRATAGPDAASRDGGRPFGRRVVPIRHGCNRGVGGAIKTGYRRALADRIDVTAVMAGDGQMDPDHLPSLLDPIVEGAADYAKGDRLRHGDYRRSMPRFRQVGNAILTGLTRVSSGYWRTSDPQNGYTAISLRALEAVDVASLYEGYGYCNDLLARLNAERLRVADVPVPAVYGDEESTIEYTTYVPTVSALLARTFVRRLGARYPLGDAHPVPLLYGAGALSVGASLVGALRSALRARGGPDERGPVAIGASALLLLAGCAFLAMAATLERRLGADLEVRRDA